MPQGEHSAILLTFIKQSFVIKIFVLSILSGRFRQVLLYIDLYLDYACNLIEHSIAIGKISMVYHVL